MNLESQLTIRAVNPFTRAFQISLVMFALVAALFLRALGVPLVGFALFLATAALLWAAFRHPVFALGTILAAMPIYPMAILLGRFFGPPFMMSDLVKACDRIALLLLMCILLWRNGIKLKAPDWFLLAGFGLAVIRLAFGGSLLA